MQAIPHIERAVDYLKQQLGTKGVIVLFGSRARGTARKNADFDIGVWTDALAHING